MKLKTIAKLFGAVVEDDYGSPQRDTTLPGWFGWYLDHMPVRENVYGTLIDIGLTGTQANVIIERIWPQVASIQQEAIDLAKAGNESGAIAKLNEAASLAERLAREAAEHERLLGRGIEPEPPRRMEERDMAAQAAKADWPRQVVERDNYILINGYLGADYAQANPELVETLVRIAADYLLARPDVAFDNLWAYTYDALKKMYPARERGIEVGGGMMEANTIAKMFGARERFEGPVELLPFSEQIMKKTPLSYKDAVRELERYIDTFNLSPADRDRYWSDVSDFWLWAEPRKTMYPDYTDALTKAKAWADQHYGPQKTGGGIMPKLLSLRSILMAAASLGDLLSLLRKVKEPTKEVSAAIKKLEGMVAKYDEGAKLEDVNTAAMKRILTQLKKVPKPTKDQPRTRVLRAVKLLEDLLKTKVSSAVLQASIVQVARILKAVDEPTEEVKDAIKLADQLAKSYEEGGPKKYGKVVSVEGLTKLLKMLEAIEEKPDPVVKAVAALKKLLGAEEEKPTAPGERGELPSYGLAKLEAAIKPGVYRARLIRAGEALDGTTWPEEQLKIAFEKGYFEGVPVNAISYTGQYGPDIEYHLPLDTELAGKVVGNQVGFTKDTAWDDEEHAGYGFVYITDSERRNLIDAMLEQGLDAPGMSIYADGMKDENDVVTGINGVTSMDLVTFPAADGAILSQALTASVKEWGEVRKRLRTAAEAGPAKFTPGEGEGAPPRIDWAEKWELIWEPKLEEPLRGYVKELVSKVWKTFEGLDIKVSSEALMTWGIESADDAVITILEKVDNDLYRLFSEADFEEGRLPIWGSALARKYTTEYETEIMDKSTQWWERVTGTKVGAKTESKKTGGGIMSPTALEQRLDVVEKISQSLNERVVQADTDGMIELKLQASKLPEKVQVALRGQLLGKQLTEEEVDSFIKFQQGITDDLATELAATAHVTLGGGVLPGEGKDTLKGALTALFEKQK